MKLHGFANWNDFYVASTQDPIVKSLFFSANEALIAFTLLQRFGIKPGPKFFGYDFEDYVQLSYIALTKAYNTFNPELAKWSTYATTIIRNEILMVFRKNKHYINMISLDQPYCEDEESLMHDIVGKLEPERSDPKTVHESLKEIYRFLRVNPRDQRLLELRIFHGLSESQVAKELGVTRGAISNVLRKFRAKGKMIKEILEEFGYV